MESDRKAVESWLLAHHGVRQEVLTGKDVSTPTPLAKGMPRGITKVSCLGQSYVWDGLGGRRFRYRGFTLTWYHTGTILLQGPGLGSVRFKGLKCEKCKDKPLVIQGLEYMVTQADKRNKETPWPPKRHGPILDEIHRRRVSQHQTSPVFKRPGLGE